MPSRNSIVKRLVAAANRLLGYQAVVSTPRRSQTFLKPTLKSEDRVLPYHERSKLLALTRNLVRNFSAVAWAVRQHCTYVSSFSPAIRGVQQALKQDIARRLQQWQQPHNFDITRRRSLSEILFQAEWCRVVDGDVFLISLDGKSVFLVEGDRVTNFKEVEDQYSKQFESGQLNYVEGVIIDTLGAPVAYSIGRRAASREGLEFDLITPAVNTYHLAYWSRHDQVRGISPLASAAAVFQDLYETLDYEVTKHKIAQLFGIKIIHENAPLFTAADATQEEDYPIDFGRGPYVVDLRPGDDIQVIESNHPAATSTDFYKHLITLALKALDLPYSFYDESATNYSSSRLAWLQYLATVKQKQQSLLSFLRWLTNKWLRSSIENGELPEEAYLASIEWVPVGQPWIDPLKEVQADVLALQNGLISRQEIARRHGKDYATILEEMIEDPLATTTIAEQTGIDIRAFGTAPTDGDD